MRLFVATDLDAAALDEIGALQWRLKRRVGERGSLKWTRPEQMHLTLAFIGEADEMLAAKLIAAMQTRAAQAAFEITFQGVGVFPPHGAPRILWLGVGRGAADLIALQQDVATRVEALGVRLEDRPFHPHLTLGRWRDGRPSDRRAIDEMADTGVVATASVDHATLYRSHLSPGGSIYAPVARVTLGSSA